MGVYVPSVSGGGSLTLLTIGLDPGFHPSASSIRRLLHPLLKSILYNKYLQPLGLPNAYDINVYSVSATLANQTLLAVVRASVGYVSKFEPL